MPLTPPVAVPSHTAPPTVPVRTDRANFPTQMHTFQTWEAGAMVTDMDALADNAHDNAQVAYDAAVAAAASETAAAASAALAGASATFGARWNFDSSTTLADPGQGDLRLNHATPASATVIAVSAQSADTGNPDISAAVLTWDDSTTTANRGTLTLRKLGAPQVYAQYAITGASTNNTTWIELAVTYIDGNGTLTNGDALAVGFSRTGDQGSLAGGNLTGALNHARATVASAATTADIWGAAGNVIDWTGTTTCTGFPAAPQAGASRLLVTAGAAPFTAGANMLIDGVASGNTYTCAAGDKVTVTAKTTTQFELTIQKKDGTAVVVAAAGAGDHEVYVTTGNGYGSTNTCIRRFTTTQRSVGTAITYADSAANGASFTINEAGDYLIQWADVNSGGAAYLGFSVNSSQLTTSISSITAANRLAICQTPAAGVAGMVSAVYRAAVNDVIRPHAFTNLDSTGVQSWFRIKKVNS